VRVYSKALVEENEETKSEAG